MAREDLDINIRERGARTVSRAIDNIARAADRATKDLFLLVRAFRAVRDAAILLGGFGAVSEFIRQLDQITLYENRIRLVTSSFAELKTVYGELVETAVRSRSPLESIVELYSRTALSAKDLGVSQQEVIRFTESVAKAATLSGATVREANAALIQLSQGVASNRLGGDELRSILEQLPFVADVIAKSLGVTRGELRKLGSEGKITGEVILKAFRDARVEIDTLFNTTVSTVAQSLNVLGVRFLEAFGQLDDFLGLTETLSGAILTLASNFDVLGGAVLAVTAAFATFFTLRYIATIGTLITVITTLTGAFLVLGRAILFSPIAMIAAALVGAYVAARTFGSEITVLEGKINTYADVAQAAFEIAYDAVTEYFEGVGIVAERVFNNLGINFPRTFRELGQTLYDWANQAIRIFIGLEKALPEILANLPGAIGETFNAVTTTVLFRIENLINRIIQLVENGLQAILLPVATFLKDNTAFLPGDGSFAEDVYKFAEAVENFATLPRVDITTSLPEPSFERYGRNIANALRNAFTDELMSTDFIAQGVKAVLDRSDRYALQRLVEQVQNEADLTKPGSGGGGGGGDGDKKGSRKKTFEDFLREILGQNEALKVNSELRERLLKVVSVEKSLRRELTTAERNLYLGLLEVNQSLERQSEIFDSLREPQRAYGNLVRDLNSLLSAGRISIDEFNKKLREGRIEMLELAETPLAGLERGFYQVTESALDFSRFTEEAVTGTFSKLEDAIAEFVTTGKLNFRSFVTDVSAMLVRLATNQALQYLFNAAGSALFSGFAPRTSGGSATALSVPSFNLAPSGGFRIPGAADGGVFEVSSRIGSPRAGRDNRFVPMYLRDGEMVEVTPRGQSQRRSGVVVNMTVYANDAGSFRASQDQIAADMGRRLSRAQRNE